MFQIVHHHCISPENMLCSDKDGTHISFFGTTEMLLFSSVVAQILNLALILFLRL